jgi:uncharacterized BrkB/YihY/UPF0761 family membrane protein
MLKSIIKNEFLSISLKLILGITFSILIIYSFIEFEINYKIFLSQYVNGLMLQLITLLIVISFCFISLYLLLKNSKKQKKDELIFKNIDLQKLSLNFIIGILQGHEEAKKKKTN